jgi:outer membrane protein assembly factor BamB
MRTLILMLLLGGPLAGVGEVFGGDWPQFRGVNSSGLAVGDRPLPVELGPAKNAIWKTALPPGHSSPVVSANRIFLTAVRDNSLVTIALDRSTGKIVWEAEAPCRQKEVIHRIGSYAQPSPATDGEVVVSFFGSSGLLCYDMHGKQLWHLPTGPFNDDYGAGSSPILVDDRILVNQDHDTDSFLMAVDKRTGSVIWKTDRSEFPRNYATPVIWQVNGERQIVVPATLRVVGYDFETGGEVWTVRGISRIVIMTPVVGQDGTLYVAAWAPGGDETERIEVLPFAQFAATYDKDGNGTLQENEFPDGPVRQRFRQFDRDKTGHVTKEEYESMREIFDAAHNVIIAIRPGGVGDITHTHVLWKYGRLLPYCPSPVVTDGLVFMVKEGGVVSCLDAKTGRPTKQGRVSGTAGYYSSPVAGDGKVYLLSQRGELTVISAEPQWQELSSARFEEDAYATPAVVNGRIYLRTAGHLYCFGLTDSSE